MNKYQRTNLWRRTLADQGETDQFKEERDRLRISYQSFRDRATLLAKEIPITLREFTVHDETHFDALWEMADMIIGENYLINPAEAYVLGCSFLLHDLGMGLSAYPNGLEEIKTKDQWSDIVIRLYKERGDLITILPTVIDPTIQEKATIEVLRLLHAEQANKLIDIKFVHKNIEYHLLDDADLRKSFGSTIGLVAFSHWWDIEEINNKLNSVKGPATFLPKEWKVDKLSVACILRLADYSHLDDRRAPGFLRVIRKPVGNSDVHWSFQGNLDLPFVEKDRIVFTGKPFDRSEINAWWLCYDTLKGLDIEIRRVDALLSDLNRTTFKVKGVSGIESPGRLERHIPTDKWVPVDAQIKVSDVVKLVYALGGKELYDDENIVPIRELIQNASDAVRARRILQGKTNEWGDIMVGIEYIENGYRLSVKDNGVGMSQDVLTGPFLDFGNSFWRSGLVEKELPGLLSKGFNSTGKFGIGFYSVFMISHNVKVITRKYTKGEEDTLVLEFTNGLEARPILRKAELSERLGEPGTEIQIECRDKGFIRFLKVQNSSSNLSLEKAVIGICPAIDVNISVLNSSNEQKQVIAANDWLTISGEELFRRISASKSVLGKALKKRLPFANNISKMKNETGRIIGRGFFIPVDYLGGYVCSGGIKLGEFSGFIGIFEGAPKNAARDHYSIEFTSNNFKQFMVSQVDAIAKMNLSERDNYVVASMAYGLCGYFGKLPIGKLNNQFVHIERLQKELEGINEIAIVNVDFLNASMHHFAKFNKALKKHGNVLYIKTASLSTPLGADSIAPKKSYFEMIVQMVERTWSDCSLAVVKEQFGYKEDKQEYVNYPKNKAIVLRTNTKSEQLKSKSEPIRLDLKGDLNPTLTQE